ncbi:SpoIIE family protein phosphatase [Nocardioides sp. MAH-18]|uniref:SpoIIE family protein phosphatase n=1 Tax=Nocardioides agri TaxID=2682843 RepID=A0A6L6XUF1_9ACTN|nr:MULTISPECIES: SpoIIE family protein phosphatase [unclassified Nocardioides]MBA2955407.1 SpoIIE family protein phosphatase [Nocardioides sp. CGMCC 1.13656]MVQ50257.1 SpoIIE family protein phosphatase [Nocardioides sp. MAH-18]
MDDHIADLGSVEAMVGAFRDGGIVSLVVEGPDLRLVAANDLLRPMAGGRDLLGLPYSEAFPGAVGQGFAELYHRVMETGEPIANHDWRVQVDLPGGVTDFYASFWLAPWRNPDGTVRGVVGHAIDVTDETNRRLQVEAQRKDAERRYEHARAVVLTLQDSLLPDALPVVPGLQTSGRYLLAQDDAAAGGDWLDVIALPTGRTILVVGDVVGHGVAASALMGQTRAVLGERLSAGVPITEALEALDRAARRNPEATATTVAVVDLDPATGDLTYCTAGHPPPLLVAGDATRYLRPTGAGPLASGHGFPTAQAHLGEGEVLLLYTDGIIERPGREPARATIDLATVARRSHDGTAFRDAGFATDRVSSQTLELLVRDGGYSDDITLLAAQRVPPPEPLDLTFDADPRTPHAVRRSLDDWLKPLGVADVDAFALKHAATEVVTNILDHAYRDAESDGAARPGRLTATLEATGDAVVRISDHGRWRGPSPLGEGRGRGLMMVNQLIDHVTISPAGVPGGTVVTLRHALARQVQLLAGADRTTTTAGAGEERFRTDTTDDGATLRVHGAVDTASAGSFRAALFLHTSRPGARLQIDLNDVTLLASVGVQALVDVLATAAAEGVTVAVVAAPGTTAQHVLHLARLDSEDAAPHLER